MNIRSLSALFLTIAQTVVCPGATDTPSADDGSGAAQEKAAEGDSGADPPSGSVPLKAKQSLIKGLLLAEVGSADFAAKMSQMNATAIAGGEAAGDSSLQFNQEVGADMDRALMEVRKFLTVRHHGWPVGHQIEISFEEKFGPKAGPSAAVACALMIESLIVGAELDARTAVTGDLNADGSVQPVGGVSDKIRGAINGGCSVVVIPKKCEVQVCDAALVDGIAPLLAIQVFSVSTFDQAWEVAGRARPAALKHAIETFDTIQQALRRQPNAAASLRHPKVVERLQQIVSEAPNHYSAGLLLLHAQGKNSKRLSASGSWMQLAKSGDLLIRAARDRSTDALAPDALGVAVGRLTRLRPSLDPRLNHYSDSLVDLANAVRRLKDQPPRTDVERQKAVTRIEAIASAADSEFERLRADKSLMEELLP